MEDQGEAIRLRPGSGGAFASVWALAVPVSLEMAAIRLGQLLDLFWVGRLGAGALALVAMGLSLRWAASSLASGLAAGGMALVARANGEGNTRSIGVAAWQTIMLTAALSLVLAGAGYALAAPLLRLLGATAELLPDGVVYLRVTLLGLVPLTFVYAVNALLRATDQATRAVTLSALAVALGAVLEPFLVLGWGPFAALGLTGAALATMTGQTAVALFQIVLLSLGKARLRLERRSLELSLSVMGRIIRIGATASAELFLRAVSRLALIAIIAGYGVSALAGYAVANGILMGILVPSYALGHAGAALVLQGGGSSWLTRALRRGWLAGALSTVYMMGAVGALFPLAPQAIAAFNGDPALVAHGADALRIVSLGYISSSLGVVTAHTRGAAGEPAPPAAVNVLTLWGVQIPAAVLLGRLVGTSGVWLGLAIGAVINGVATSYWYRRDRG